MSVRSEINQIMTDILIPKEKKSTNHKKTELMVQCYQLWRNNTQMLMECENGDDFQHNTKMSAAVSPLSARMVLCWFICTTGFRANHFNRLRFFRHFFRYFVVWRTSAQMSIHHKLTQEEEKAGEEEGKVLRWQAQCSPRS